MIPAEIIRRKRDGQKLSAHEIAFFIDSFAREEIGAEQASAFAMAVFFQNMDADEIAHLTRAMARSGTMLDWRVENLGGPVLDKHSTGGVGDNVSLVLAPILAACGAFVPMISGRGLGHTGGTLDKLDSIPGYLSQPDLETFRRVVKDAGCAIIGQTPDLAPADRRLYAIRDVTATVESIALITASILSKKLAAGLDGLVMDVKCGNGAFMSSREDARTLARSIVDTATAAGLPTVAQITAMDAPLASCAGNAVEMRHALDHLSGRAKEQNFLDVTFSLAAEMILLGGLADDADVARLKAEDVLYSGRAAERFAQMCAALGGPHDILERAEKHLPQAPVRREVFATTQGVIADIDTRALGLAVIALGGGRKRAGDRIDHAVGFTDLARFGDASDRPLAIVHARDDAAADRAELVVRDAYAIADRLPDAAPMILERVFADPSS